MRGVDNYLQPIVLHFIFVVHFNIYFIHHDHKHDASIIDNFSDHAIKRLQ